ncbi:MAG: hypothetical protein K2O95_07060 [Clostridia bacterium]|nr:hypothetical protein [Clostridia bacterium]
MADNDLNIQQPSLELSVGASEQQEQENAIEEITQPSAEINSAQVYIADQEEIETNSTEEVQNASKNTEEKNADTPSETKIAVYESKEWQSKVEEFFEKYPVAKGFASMIGEQIVNDDGLSYDDNCLEKALARVFDKVYVPPKELVKDQQFLEKYVYQDENIKNAVIEKYLEELENNRQPKSFSSRGKITLTPPDRPKSIAEAGNVIKSMLKNRRI